MELAARIGTMAATAGGLPFRSITIENASLLGGDFASEIIRQIGDIACFVVSKITDTSAMRNDFPIVGVLRGTNATISAGVGSLFRFRNGLVNHAGMSNGFDIDSRIGDEYWVIPVPFSTEGGGNKCLTPRRSYRRLARPSARFCAHSRRWEVAA